MQQLRRNKKSRRFWLRKNIFRGRRANPLKRKLTYNYSSKLQTLGPGSCVINITSQINEAEVTGLSYLDIQGMLISNNEWEKYNQAYRIYKLEQIAVTIYPNDNLNNSPTYINLDWFNTVQSDAGMRQLDSTKIVFNDLKKPKTFFFKPPNMMMQGGNPRKFNIRSYLPLAVLYFSQDSGSLRGRVDARVVFKVPSEFTNSKDIKLKKVEKLIKLDENEMLDSNLKTINNLRLTGVHQTSFSYVPEEQEIPEEEKLEEDEEEPQIITKKNDLSWSLFEQIYNEDKEKEEKKKEKRKEKKLKRKKKIKEMKNKIKKSKLFKKIINKEKDKILKEAQSDATFAEQIKQERRKQAEEHYLKRKKLGEERKERKAKEYQEDPMKVIKQQVNKREIKRSLLKRNQEITNYLASNSSTKNENLNKIWKEKDKIQRALQHLNRGKLDDKDNSYLCDLKNHVDNKGLDLEC